MQDHYTIDKARVRQSFHRAARHYDAAAILQRQVREEMLGRLDLVNLQPRQILDAGCGTGHGLKALLNRFKGAHGLALDLAPGMLARTRQLFPRYRFWQAQPDYLCADIESLPLATASVDLAWSNLAIQWCNDLDAALQEFRRVLRPEGLLMFATLGPDTLKELRAASGQQHTHVSRFIDMHDIGDALTRAGFFCAVLDVMHYTLTYDTVESVMRDLKAIGAHNATAGRAKGLSGKGFLQQLRSGYETFRVEGKLPATYEVVFVHAWVGSQPYTAPGSSPVQFMPRPPPSMMSMQALPAHFFVTGTDTGVGKTHVTAYLLRHYAAQGLRVIGMKPVASGCAWIDGQWQNEDVARLVAASNVDAPLALVNPYRFDPPIAPHIAADQAGVHIDLAVITEAYRQLKTLADVVIVEGAGGLLVPLNASQTMADLMQALGLPGLLVVGMKLGCINHALLTAAVMQQQGIACCGWVANHVDPQMQVQSENLQSLQAGLQQSPCLQLPYQTS